MTTEWYIHADGETFGPFTFREMAELADDGRLSPETNVAHPGSEEWTKASDDAALSSRFTQSPRVVGEYNGQEGRDYTAGFELSHLGSHALDDLPQTADLNKRKGALTSPQGFVQTLLPALGLVTLPILASVVLASIIPGATLFLLLSALVTSLFCLAKPHFLQTRLPLHRHP